jgi:hypothetical protein
MPTGACGINCDVCKLRLTEICSSCGPGKSTEAQKKLEAQKRLLGKPCPILACASMNRVDHCMRDCIVFPCDNFTSGPYPFSEGFLTMQQRRRKQRPPALNHNRTPVVVPVEYWDTLRQRDVAELCNWTLAQPQKEGGFQIRSLHQDILVDVANCCLKRMFQGRCEVVEDPLLELITLLYLNNVNGTYTSGKDLVGPQDLKEAHYFIGSHALPLAPLLERYGGDTAGFRQAAEYLGGQALDIADAAYRLLPFPRVPLYYLLWEGDEEFGPKLSVLFDRSIERIFSASAIWTLVKLVSTALLLGPEQSLVGLCQRFSGNKQ